MLCDFGEWAWDFSAHIKAGLFLPDATESPNLQPDHRSPLRPLNPDPPSSATGLLGVRGRLATKGLRPARACVASGLQDLSVADDLRR